MGLHTKVMYNTLTHHKTAGCTIIQESWEGDWICVVSTQFCRQNSRLQAAGWPHWPQWPKGPKPQSPKSVGSGTPFCVFFNF